MTNPKNMSLEAFCPLDQHLITKEVDGSTWIVFDRRLCKTLMLPARLLAFMPAHDTRRERGWWKDKWLISERLFYQIVLASPAPKAVKFRRWVAETLLWRWYERTSDLQDIQNAERLRYSPSSVFGEIEAIVSEHLVTARNHPDSWS